MIRRAHRSTGLKAPRILAALLLVLAQSLTWAMPQAQASGPVPAWIDGTPICHSGPDSGQTDDHSGTMPDCALCLVCHAAGVAAVLPDPVSAPDSLRSVASVFRPSFAHAPPADPFRRVQFSTGPPALA